MGNCLRKCFGQFDRRRQFLHTRYSVEKEASIEFANLMDEEEVRNEMSKLVTEREKQLVANRQYNTLLTEQQIRDTAIDRKLQEDEEELKREEEAYIEARREAARIAQLQKEKEEIAKTKNGPKSWKSGEGGEWEVAGGDDDFEMFLESVRERSLKATAHLRKDSPVGGTSSRGSTPTQARERTHTEGSNSMELEWDDDDPIDDTGLTPVRKERSNTEEDLMKLAKQERRNSQSSPTLSVDFEWDTEFVAADDKDTQNLLSADFRIGDSDR
ncbi:Regulatory protein [Mactra antiquata]